MLRCDEPRDREPVRTMHNSRHAIALQQLDRRNAANTVTFS
jgi:hypothetical protein